MLTELFSLIDQEHSYGKNKNFASLTVWVIFCHFVGYTRYLEIPYIVNCLPKAKEESKC
jgi:hypothetical protein